MDETSDTTPWRKATASTGGGGCLEFRQYNGMVEFRDSKQGKDGPVLRFTGHEMRCFLVGRAGDEFADLLEGLD